MTKKNNTKGRKEKIMNNKKSTEKILNDAARKVKEENSDLLNNDTARELFEEGLELIRINVDKVLNYQPKIGVFGKTGVGKSSLCNALFGKEACLIDDVKACTRDPQEVLINIGAGKSLTLVDVPGIGESGVRDEEYAKLYSSLLPELDMVIWVIKGDDRTFSSDEAFYNGMVKPHIKEGMPFIVALNQVDKIEPYRQWDIENNMPGNEQRKNIEEKITILSSQFQLPQSRIVPVSAADHYNLSSLVGEIIFSLPEEKQYRMSKEINPDLLTRKTKERVKKNTKSWVVEATMLGARLGAKFGPIGVAVGAAIGFIAGVVIDTIFDLF